MDNDIVLIDQGKRDVTGRLYATSALMEAIYLKRIDILPARSSSKAPTPPTRPSNSTRAISRRRLRLPRHRRPLRGRRYK